MAVDFIHLIESCTGEEPKGLARKIFQDLTDNHYFPNHFQDSLRLGHRHFLLFEAAELSDEEIADFFDWKLKRQHQRDSFKISYIEHLDRTQHILFIGFRNLADAHAFCRDFNRNESVLSLGDIRPVTARKADKRYRENQKLAR